MTNRVPEPEDHAAHLWRYQLRLRLADDAAETARRGGDSSLLAPLRRILEAHNATLRCQYDLFADYCAEAEQQGVETYPLYAWTKATIEDCVKKAKYVRAFSIYIDGDEVYDKARADAIEAELQPLVHGGVVAALARHDTNPANSPQIPECYRQ